MKRSTLKSAFLFIFFQFFIYQSLSATILHVPSDFPTIQTGIIFSVPGDTVLVAPGTYTGDGNKEIDFLGKDIIVMSGDGPENTIIDLEFDGQGFNFHLNETNAAQLIGFKIINATYFAINCSNSSPTIINCIVENCTFTNGGLNKYSISIYNSSIILEKCIIRNNPNWGIYSYTSGSLGNYKIVRIKDCVIENNNQYGIRASQGSFESKLIFQNTVVANNGLSGIQVSHNGDVIITNCSVYGNQNGGINANNETPLFIDNTIIWGNVDPNSIFDNLFAVDPIVSYSNIGGTGWPGTGNINADPLFVDPANNDFHLMANSPCIDTADNSVIDFPTDLDGNVRIWDGDGDGSPIVDMGAYEYGAPPYQLLGITEQPVGTTACEGEDVGFSVGASGILLTYQWYLNNTEITGATDSTLQLNNVSTSDAGNYTCTVTDFVGNTATSQVALLNINASVTPAISISANAALCAGDAITFTSAPSNEGDTPTYQWQVNGMDVGTNTPEYTSSGLDDGDLITCTLTSSELCLFENPVASNVLTVQQLPVVSIINNSQEICEGEGISLSASGGEEYLWEGPNNSYSGSEANVDIAQATLEMDGTYSVTITDAAGCSNTGSTQVTVNALPAVDYDPVVNSACIDGDPINLMGGTPAGGTYSGNGVANNLLIPQDAGIGSANVTYTYEDPTTGCSNSSAATFDINPLPAVGFAPPQTTYCIIGNPTMLSGGTPSGGQYNGSGVSGNMFDPGAAGEGFHVITYSYEDPLTGCSNDTTATLEVVQTSPVSLSIMASTDTICAGDNVTFTAVATNGGAAPTYQWYLNGNPVGDNSNLFTTSVMSANTIISCDLTSSDECASGNPATAAISIPTVFGLPGEPSAANNGPGCVGGNVTLSAYAAGAETYKWTGPNGFMSDSAMVVLENVTLADTGIYTAVITNIVGCSVVETTEVVIYPNPMVSITPDCFPDTILTTTAPIQLAACGTPPGGNFLCGTLSCTEFDPALAGVGEHTITYQYIDPNGCSGAYSTSIVVELGTATKEEVTQSGFDVFPNPSNGNFFVKTNEIAGEVNLKLLNTLGQPVWDTAFESETAISIDGLPKGVYYLVLKKEGHVYSKRIVFQ